MPAPTAIRLEALVPVPIPLPFFVLRTRFARRGGCAVAGAASESNLTPLARGLRRGLLLRARLLVLGFVGARGWVWRRRKL